MCLFFSSIYRLSFIGEAIKYTKILSFLTSMQLRIIKVKAD
jgi:hypothetical protein